MKTRLLGLCAAFGAAGILVAVWYFHGREPIESIRVRPSPVGAEVTTAALESMPIASNTHTKPQMASDGSSKPFIQANDVPSFGSQKDLWAFAKQAEASSNVAFKYEGYVAAAECVGLLNGSEHYNKLVDKALHAGDQGPYLALGSLNKRCAGFTAVSPADGLQLVRTLKAQIASSNSDLSLLVANRELTDAQRQAALRSGSPAAMELVLPRVKSELGSGVLLAMCDLGKACGPDSFGAQLFCIQTSKCGQALWADTADEYSSEEWQAVQFAREQIVSAMRAGDLQALFKKS